MSLKLLLYIALTGDNRGVMVKPPYNILIIEDDDSVRSILRLFLAKRKYRVIEANNGLEGLGIARSMLPDLVITDLMMSGMPGVELIKELKVREETKHIPIIAMTGGDYSLQQKASEAGANAVISKPMKHKSLLTLVCSLLKA